MPKRAGTPPADPIKAAHRVVAKFTGERGSVEPIQVRVRIEDQPARKPIHVRVKLIEALPTPPKVKNPAAVALGKLGGKKGGDARKRNLTPGELSAIGKLGAAKRWTQKPTP